MSNDTNGGTDNADDLRRALLASITALTKAHDLIGEPPAGSHPDEWKPRAGTWHAERLNWITEVDGLRSALALAESRLAAADTRETKTIEALRLGLIELGCMWHQWAVQNTPPSAVLAKEPHPHSSVGRAMEAMRAALSPSPVVVPNADATLANAAGQPERVRHVKRGTTYTVLHRDVPIQCAADVWGDAPLVIYQGEDGKVWARPEDEFNDGRFVSVANAAGRGDQGRGDRED